MVLLISLKMSENEQHIYSERAHIQVGSDEILFGQGHSPDISKHLLISEAQMEAYSHAVRYLLAPGNSETEVRVKVKTDEGEIEQPAYALFLLKGSELSKLAAESPKSLYHILDIVNQEVGQTLMVVTKIKTAEKALGLGKHDMALQMLEDIDRRRPRVTNELHILEALLTDVVEILNKKHIPTLTAEMEKLSAEEQRLTLLLSQIADSEADPKAPEAIKEKSPTRRLFDKFMSVLKGKSEHHLTREEAVQRLTEISASKAEIIQLLEVIREQIQITQTRVNEFTAGKKELDVQIPKLIEQASKTD